MNTLYLILNIDYPNNFKELIILFNQFSRTRICSLDYSSTLLVPYTFSRFLTKVTGTPAHKV